MGFNTTLMVLNDHLYDITKDPERFVRELDRAASSLAPTQDIFGQTRVMHSQHADVFRLYGTHGNSIIGLTEWDQETLDLYRGNDYKRDFVRRMVREAKNSLRYMERALDRIDAERDDED